MNRQRIAILLVAILILCGSATTVFYVTMGRQVTLGGFFGSGDEAEVEVPPGFEVNIFASDLNGPRFMHVGPDGTLYVADRNNDRIVALPDNNNDGRADEIQVFAAEISNPHSLIYHEGAWYIGVPAGVIRLEDTDGDGTADVRTTLIDNYTPSGQHSTRTIEFLPDGRLLLSAGSTCNVCDEEDPRRAAITIYDSPVGQDTLTGERLFATGLRNAVGLAIHPDTGELWASNNGRDLMGDDLPPENIFQVKDGGNYGWPTCHNGNIEDPDMGFAGACDGVEQPDVEMQAHMAPLGLTFYDGTTFPESYHGDMFIALHGSWNRSEPVGYNVMRVPMSNGQVAGPAEDFAVGWLLADGQVDGRPVDVVVGADGALYVSDDRGGFIYRISAEQ